MRKWDGEPTFKLESHICELSEKAAAKKGDIQEGYHSS